MYLLDLIGTFAFAVTGAFKAKGRELNIIGVVFLGGITAIGGGTLRDMIIDRTPVFYLQDPNFLIVATVASIITYFVPSFFEKKYRIFRLLDSIGLAAFVIIGVSVTHNHIFQGIDSITLLGALSCIFLGMTTGFGGGVLRDAIIGDMPFAFEKHSNYAQSAFVGACSFYFLMFVNIELAVFLSFVLTMMMREVVSPYGIYQKVIRVKSKR